MQTPAPPEISRAPAVLLGYQARWCADRSRVKIMEKSRRVGLTWGEAADCVTAAAARNGEDCWYIGYTRDMAEEFILDCAEWAKQLNQVVSAIEPYEEEVFVEGEERKSIQAFRIRFESGWRISALSSSPRNLRGKQGRVILDEAAFHADLAELLKAALALLMWGGRVHIISTHDGAENPFNELIQEVRAGKKPYSLHRVTLDDALAEGLYERICMKTGVAHSQAGQQKWREEMYAFYGSNAAEELDCVPSRGGGIWLPRALIEARMVPGRVLRWTGAAGMDLWADHLIEAETRDFCEREILPELKPLQDVPSFIGEDFGRYSDLTVFAPCQLLAGMTRRFPFLVELEDVPFKAQLQCFTYLADRLPRFSHAKLDAGGNGSYLAEEARRKYGEDRVEQVMFTEAWYRDNAPPVKAAFEDGLIELPRHADVINDLAAFRLVKGVPRLPDRRVKGAHGEKRHGDAGIAILLAYAASRADVYQPYEYFSARASAVRDEQDFDDEDDVRTTAGFRSHGGAF